MKLSADPMSSYYNEIAQAATVFFNGRVVKDCIEADSDEGYVIQYVKDDNGKYLFNNVLFDFLVSEKRYGEVEIVVSTVKE